MQWMITVCLLVCYVLWISPYAYPCKLALEEQCSPYFRTYLKVCENVAQMTTNQTEVFIVVEKSLALESLRKRLEYVLALFFKGLFQVAKLLLFTNRVRGKILRHENLAQCI